MHVSCVQTACKLWKLIKVSFQPHQTGCWPELNKRWVNMWLLYNGCKEVRDLFSILCFQKYCYSMLIEMPIHGILMALSIFGLRKNDEMTGKLKTVWKEVVIAWLGYCPRTCLMEMKKTTENLRLVSVLLKIITKHLRNTIQSIITPLSCLVYG
jgi:hypothetical protein